MRKYASIAVALIAGSALLGCSKKDDRQSVSQQYPASSSPTNVLVSAPVRQVRYNITPVLVDETMIITAKAQFVNQVEKLAENNTSQPDEYFYKHNSNLCISTNEYVDEYGLVCVDSILYNELISSTLISTKMLSGDNLYLTPQKLSLCLVAHAPNYNPESWFIGGVANLKCKSNSSSIPYEYSVLVVLSPFDKMLQSFSLHKTIIPVQFGESLCGPDVAVPDGKFSQRLIAQFGPPDVLPGRNVAEADPLHKILRDLNLPFGTLSQTTQYGGGFFAWRKPGLTIIATNNHGRICGLDQSGWGILYIPDSGVKGSFLKYVEQLRLKRMKSM